MIPNRDQELAVLRSVIYASLFDYPLTLAQMQAGLIGVRADIATIESWWRNSDLLQRTVERQDGWYFPAGRADVIATRQRREALSRALLTRDRRILATIARLPFVRMVALSGSLAHLNAEGSADLDLFVITAPNRVWSVTVITLLLAKLLGWRKRLCLNYVVSERAMTIAPEDLFSANQIIHLRPVAGHDVFANFLHANPFVQAFYPNFELPSATTSRRLSTRTSVLERVARRLYGGYLMKRAATWESRDQVRLEAECLKLHTSSHRATTLAKFDAAMKDATTKFTKGTKAIKVLAS